MRRRPDGRTLGIAQKEPSQQTPPDDRFRRQAITRCRQPGRSLWLSGRRSWHVHWRRCDRPEPDARERRRAMAFAHERASASAAPDDRFRAPGDRRLASAWATFRSSRAGLISAAADDRVRQAL